MVSGAGEIKFVIKRGESHGVNGYQVNRELGCRLSG